MKKDLRRPTYVRHTGAMTKTTTTRPNFYVEIGQTEDEFQVQVEREWDDCGPYTYEYLALPWDAQVKTLRVNGGVADDYAMAAALALLVAATAKGNVVRFTVSDGTGQNFCATGWEQRADAIAELERLAQG